MAVHHDSIAVCALVPYPLDTVPGQRFRIEQWQPYLEQEGITVDFFPFADTRLMECLHQSGHTAAKAGALLAAFLRRIIELPVVHRYDVVLIHRAMCLAGPAVLERVLRLWRQPIIFDFDDAIYMLHTTAANQRFGWLKFPRKTEVICRQSDHVVVGNSFLADFARQHNQCVTMIPSSVDTNHFQPIEKRLTDRRVVVGWTGSSTSQTYLERFIPVLRELVARRGVEIRVHSDRRPALEEIPFAWRPWSPKTEAEEIAGFDIGIMPMPDEPWAYGKCAMKALLYMASGVPTICEAIGANRDVIRHGENGLLAATPKEWIAHLETLIDDASLRVRFGMAGRRTVEERYSMRHCAGLFAQVVRETITQPVPRHAMAQTETMTAKEKT
jgi:glycosyltransferase involved in cell wall biosynthesis